jgi:acetolactate synthase-1/2/3 large subunit/5-guanidino-2-oxopentanoate decarboxylase
MADGYARATGQPGLCFLITGPGFTNAMTGLGQAYSDSVPLLALVSCLDEAADQRGQLHQMRDQEGAGRTVCDWSETARTPHAAYNLIDRAFAEFQTARPRPKALHLPIALLGADAPPAPPHHGQLTELAEVSPALDEVLAYLRAAKRPLFIFGGGTQSLLVPGLVKRLGAASFTTNAGRGLVPVADPLGFGGMLSRPGSAEVIGSADLVIAVGTELSETDLWRDALGHRAPLVRVDIDPMVLADRHRAELPLCMDSQAFLLALWQETQGWEAKTRWTPEEVSSARARWRAEADAERPGILPICDALRRALPSDTVIFSDMTQFAYTANAVWDMAAPRLWHHPTGFGTLGYALPAAIGGKIGLGPEAPVLAIAGDYGFQYTLQELGTAVEEGLSLPIVLWDNAASQEIADAMIGSQIAPLAVAARNPDFKLLAEAYGAGYARPASLAEVGQSARAALKEPRPTIIHVTPEVAT